MALSVLFSVHFVALFHLSLIFVGRMSIFFEKRAEFVGSRVNEPEVFVHIFVKSFERLGLWRSLPSQLHRPNKRTGQCCRSLKSLSLSLHLFRPLFPLGAASLRGGRARRMSMPALDGGGLAAVGGSHCAVQDCALHVAGFFVAEGPSLAASWLVMRLPMDLTALEPLRACQP
jgi:hypothetical protein